MSEYGLGPQGHRFFFSPYFSVSIWVHFFKSGPILLLPIFLYSQKSNHIPFTHIFQFLGLYPYSWTHIYIWVLSNSVQIYSALCFKLNVSLLDLGCGSRGNLAQLEAEQLDELDKNKRIPICERFINLIFCLRWFFHIFEGTRIGDDSDCY